MRVTIQSGSMTLTARTSGRGWPVLRTRSPRTSGSHLGSRPRARTFGRVNPRETRRRSSSGRSKRWPAGPSAGGLAVSPSGVGAPVGAVATAAGGAMVAHGAAGSLSGVLQMSSAGEGAGQGSGGLSNAEARDQASSLGVGIAAVGCSWPASATRGPSRAGRWCESHGNDRDGRCATGGRRLERLGSSYRDSGSRHPVSR